MAKVFGCCRVAYNDAIAACQEAYANGEKHPNYPALSSKHMAAKDTTEREWMREVSGVPLQQAVRDAASAYTNFFASVKGTRKGKRIGVPRFKQKSSRQSARFTKGARFSVWEKGPKLPGKIHSRWGIIRLAKIGNVKFRLSRNLPADASSVSLIREPLGQYFLSFVVQVAHRESAISPGKPRAAGVDMGLTHFAAVVYSDGSREKIDNQRFLKSKLRKLARAQKELARRQKGSSNRNKTRIKVARIHQRVASSRLDHHNKISTRLIRENQAIAVESLNIRGLGRTRLAKSIHDAGWGIFLRLLSEKSNVTGNSLVKINQWEPTSQVCPICGVQSGKKSLSIRKWECSECNTFLDRDYAAALNILVAAGRAETINACGGNIRLQLAEAVPDETRTKSRPAA